VADQRTPQMRETAGLSIHAQPSPARAAVACTAAARGRAAAAGADGQRIRLLSAAGLPHVGPGRMDGHRRHGRGPHPPRAGRRSVWCSAGGRGPRRGPRAGRPLAHPRLRAPGPDRQTGPARGRGRLRHAGRHQARQAPARRARRLRARAGPALRPGPPARGAGLPGDRRHDLLRREPRAASASASSSTTSSGLRPSGRSKACGSPPWAAASRRRSRTARNARAARWSASACRTRSTSSRATRRAPGR
jgi:hypothetical protein